MKGSLKELIRSYSDEDYVLDFDMSQVEQRIMVSLSGYSELIKKMSDPENDAHTETASMVEGKDPYKITPKERKLAKSVTFGKPYGLGIKKLCEKMYGNVTSDNLIQTRIVADKWEKNNAPIVELLERARAEALTEWKISTPLRDFMGMWEKNEDGSWKLDTEGKKIPIPVSKVTNILGFYRVFSLKGIDLTQNGIERRAKGDYTAEESSIRRQAGNYPIQATASELFRLILIRFHEACERYGIGDKVKWHMLVHDELLCSVNKSVHPFLLYKIVKEACMITLKGHTKYFVGINIGDTWAQCKDDKREAPVHFVSRMVKRYEAGEFTEKWVDDPWKFIKPYREKYIEERIGEVIKRIQPGLDIEPVNVPLLLNRFTNYTVKAYISGYPLNGCVDFEVDAGNPDSVAVYDDLKWVKSLESWVLDVYGEGKEMFDINGNLYKVRRCNDDEGGTENEEDFDESFEEFDDESSYWSFDYSSASIIYETESSEDLSEDNYELPELKYDFSREGDNVTDLTIKETRYDNLKIINQQIVISLDDRKQLKPLQNILSASIARTGFRVVFSVCGARLRWERIKLNYDLDSLDDFIGHLKHPLKKRMIVAGKFIMIRMDNSAGVKQLVKCVSKYPGKDYMLIIQNQGNFNVAAKFSKSVSLQKLEELTELIYKKYGHCNGIRR